MAKLTEASVVQRSQKNGRTNSALFHDLTINFFLYKQANLSLTREFKEGGGATIFEPVDEIGMLETKQFYGHLTGDEFDFSFTIILTVVFLPNRRRQ